MLEHVRPGGTIYEGTKFSRGTLTCFARKAGKKALFGITARHCLPSGGRCLIAGNDQLPIPFGKNAVHLDKLDALYFEIEDNVRSQLEAGNFIPLGATKEPGAVSDMEGHDIKVGKAQNYDLEQELKAKTIDAYFSGGAQFRAKQTKCPAKVNKSLRTVTNTTIQPGDSGGCIYNFAETKYIGIISTGDTLLQAESGTFVPLSTALSKAGLILATWTDNPHWK
jgi:hypothetical protein